MWRIGHRISTAAAIAQNKLDILPGVVAEGVSRRQLQLQLHDIVRKRLACRHARGILLMGKALSSVTWRDSNTTSDRAGRGRLAPNRQRPRSGPCFGSPDAPLHRPVFGICTSRKRHLCNRKAGRHHCEWRLPKMVSPGWAEKVRPLGCTVMAWVAGGAAIGVAHGSGYP